jgi:protein tyrosine/serine phosphatase
MARTRGQDITGVVTTRLRKRLGLLRERIADQIPLGPDATRLTPREIRLQLQDMDPATKSKMIRGAGPEEWSRLMEELYGS